MPHRPSPGAPKEKGSIKEKRTARMAELIERLRQVYPEAHCELDATNPLELLVATILSAQCTDVQVNKVTKQLFQKYRQAADYANAPLAELEADLSQIGLFRSKAKNLQSCARTLLERHQGQVPSDMDALCALAGVGRKTANVVLGNAFSINVGIVVDTHVARLSRRLALTRQTTPEKIEAALMKRVPQDLWCQFSHWLIFHGRRCCRARNPACEICPLQDLCSAPEKKERA